MNFEWVDGFTVAVKVEDNSVVITANKEGLLSLANHLTSLANEDAPTSHLHLDQYNSLEDGSTELIIEKTI